MSRVSYVMMNPGGDAELTGSVRAAVDALIGEAAAEAAIERGEIFEMTVVGNPIMHHLFLGLDPTELGGAPFALTPRRRLRGASPRIRARHRARRLCLSAALHRRPCRRRRGGRRARRSALPARRADLDRRRRHQRGNPVRQSRGPARLLVADRPRVRGRADFLRPARRARRDRTGADRPRYAGAALQGDRLGSMVGRSQFRSRRPLRSASPGSAARESSRRSRRCICPASSRRTA